MSVDIQAALRIALQEMVCCPEEDDTFGDWYVKKVMRGTGNFNPHAWWFLAYEPIEPGDAEACLHSAIARECR